MIFQNRSVIYICGFHQVTRESSVGGQVSTERVSRGWTDLRLSLSCVSQLSLFLQAQIAFKIQLQLCLWRPFKVLARPFPWAYTQLQRSSSISFYEQNGCHRVQNIFSALSNPTNTGNRESNGGVQKILCNEQPPSKLCRASPKTIGSKDVARCQKAQRIRSLPTGFKQCSTRASSVLPGQLSTSKAHVTLDLPMSS